MVSAPNKKFLPYLLVIVVFAGVVLFYFINSKSETALQYDGTINNYDSCIAAGFSNIKTNPAQCETNDGRVFQDTER